MTPRLVLLGTGTCQLEPARGATAALVELPGLRLVFDFGRGTAGRLVERGLRQDDVRRIILSHFHTDHWSDLLPYLQAASHSQIDRRTVDLEIFSTPEVIAMLDRLFALFGKGELIADERFRVRLRPVSGERLEIDGHRIDFVPLPPAGNHGIRFSAGPETWALTGDSHFHRREIDFLAGVDLAVIDAGHLSDNEIVDLAAACQARKLVCSHLYRELDREDLGRRAAAAGFRGRISIARELEVFTPGAAG